MVIKASGGYVSFDFLGSASGTNIVLSDVAKAARQQQLSDMLAPGLGGQTPEGAVRARSQLLKDKYGLRGVVTKPSSVVRNQLPATLSAGTHTSRISRRFGASASMSAGDETTGKSPPSQSRPVISPSSVSPAAKIEDALKVLWKEVPLFISIGNDGVVAQTSEEAATGQRAIKMWWTQRALAPAQWHIKNVGNAPVFIAALEQWNNRIDTKTGPSLDSGQEATLNRACHYVELRVFCNVSTSSIKIPKYVSGQKVRMYRSGGGYVVWQVGQQWGDHVKVYDPHDSSKYAIVSKIHLDQMQNGTYDPNKRDVEMIGTETMSFILKNFPPAPEGTQNPPPRLPPPAIAINELQRPGDVLRGDKLKAYYWLACRLAQSDDNDPRMQELLAILIRIDPLQKLLNDPSINEGVKDELAQGKYENIFAQLIKQGD
ncbi:MAG: hypothetical protein ACD_62C00531G0006 [uncultured bacterium]|nr:MAG: hypothetical protein ACD_62C00531G0006 [uncultured bacterium]HLD46141.1 hypothetical protein [bacterium]